MEQTSPAPDGVAERIRRHSSSLTAAERRVAEVLLREPQTVAFGTVADLATAAPAGAGTVVRCAAKLGYDGFAALQAAVQSDLVGRLRPAAERIREQLGGDRLASHLQTEVRNVRSTLEAVDPVVLDRAVDRLSDIGTTIVIAAGDASSGIADQAAAELGLLRGDVHVLRGNETAVRRDLALHPDDTVFVVIDLRRYDRWILGATDQAVERGWPVVAVTDSSLSPLAVAASEPFVASAGTVGPFDSHVGIMALLGLLVNEVANRLEASATERLDAVERAWRHTLADP